MSSPEAAIRIARRLPVFLIALALGGCFQPVYAQRSAAPQAASATSAPGTASQLAAVDVLAINGRVGQQVRNELVFALTGGGQEARAEYRLAVNIKNIGQSAVVDPFTDRAEFETYGLDAAYLLTRAGTAEPVLSGNAFARATYSRNRQRFASVRARRDAEDRAARIVAEQILSRLAAHFSTGG